MKSKRRYLVVGLGILGRAVVNNLTDLGAEVIAVDRSNELVNKFNLDTQVAIECEATDRQALEQLDVENLDSAIVCIGEDFKSAVLITAHLADLGVKKVIVRANDTTSASILKRVGATDIFFVESEMGREIANKVFSAE
ncbi:MAG: hypothetical protein A2Z20_00260 [Bdellovibrionales bacterium RBG_16_40_8]|nr:MAG: hypothetical protein A2Z20_00260 [Bdellovibrionales bacterium RBG_16_40_8]